MSEIITEKKYPVNRLWILQVMTGSLFKLSISIVILILLFKFSSFMREAMIDIYGKFEGIEGIWFIVFVVIVVNFIILLLKLLRFKYSLKDNIIEVVEGKIRMEFSYSDITNINVKQDYLDKIFNLYALVVKYNKVDNSKDLLLGFLKHKRNYKMSRIGTYDDSFIIPGLSQESAEILKYEITNRMKDNVQKVTPAFI